MENYGKYKLTKRKLGNIIRKMLRQHYNSEIKYFGGFHCCNNCFTNDLKSQGIRNYIYLKHGLSGINYTSSSYFDSFNEWALAHDTEYYKEIAERLAEHLETYNYDAEVEIPENDTKCIMIKRAGEGVEEDD